MDKLKPIECKCGCGLVIDLTNPKGAIVPRTHELDLNTMTMNVKRTKTVRLQTYQLN